LLITRPHDGGLKISRLAHCQKTPSRTPTRRPQPRARSTSTARSKQGVGWPGASQPPAPTQSRRDSLPSPGSSHPSVSTRGSIASGRMGWLSLDQLGPPPLEPLGERSRRSFPADPAPQVGTERSGRGAVAARWTGRNSSSTRRRWGSGYPARSSSDRLGRRWIRVARSSTPLALSADRWQEPVTDRHPLRRASRARKVNPRNVNEVRSWCPRRPPDSRSTSRWGR